TSYDFRLKFLEFTNGYYAPGAMLTPGLTNQALYLDPNNYLIDQQTNLVWEFDPVEVMARPRPVPYSVPIAAPELAAFAAANVDVSAFQNYLRVHQLALIV